MEILVVEDEPAVRAAIASALTTYGYDVTEVGSGDEALRVLRDREGAVELVILDLMLGDTSGWDVLQEMNRSGLRDSTKVLVLSAVSDEEEVVRGWEMGVDEYQTKPFDPEMLVVKVQEVLLSPREELRERRMAELLRAELLDLVEPISDEETEPAASEEA
ncbi:MAG TPA: response regulator transcription factor [Actinomycetota bacterium]|jgi:DNA-binding response OmpR family regulator|nr:response regulator transcription factor [Actinomycetota bacterium]